MPRNFDYSADLEQTQSAQQRPTKLITRADAAQHSDEALAAMVYHCKELIALLKTIENVGDTMVSKIHTAGADAQLNFQKVSDAAYSHLSQRVDALEQRVTNHFNNRLERFRSESTTHIDLEINRLKSESTDHIDKELDRLTRHRCRVTLPVWLFVALLMVAIFGAAFFIITHHINAETWHIQPLLDITAPILFYLKWTTIAILTILALVRFIIFLNDRNPY